jgi:hypothetical protein
MTEEVVIAAASPLLKHILLRFIPLAEVTEKSSTTRGLLFIEAERAALERCLQQFPLLGLDIRVLGGA